LTVLNFILSDYIQEDFLVNNNTEKGGLHEQLIDSHEDDVEHDD